MTTYIGKLSGVMNNPDNYIKITRFESDEEGGTSIELTDEFGDYIQLNVSDLMTLLPILEVYVISHSQEKKKGKFVLPNMNFEFSPELKVGATGIFKKMHDKFLTKKKLLKK